MASPPNKKSFLEVRQGLLEALEGTHRLRTSIRNRALLERPASQNSQIGCSNTTTRAGKTPSERAANQSSLDEGDGLPSPLVPLTPMTVPVCSTLLTLIEARILRPSR